MAIWNPWRGCIRYSSGCKYCYIHKGDLRRGVDTGNIVKTDKFYAPIEKRASIKLNQGSRYIFAFPRTSFRSIKGANSF